MSGFLRTVLLFGFVFSVAAMTPYNAQNGWTYNLEARRLGIWPQCEYRFLSYPEDCSGVDLWKGVGSNQEFTLETAGRDIYHLKTKCGNYLSYPGDCGNTAIDTWSEAGANQEFRITNTKDLSWSLEAVGRTSCESRFLSFNAACSTPGPEAPFTASEANAARWNAHSASSPLTHGRATDTGCADPFAWVSSTGVYHMSCSWFDLPLWNSTDVSLPFTLSGTMLGGAKPSWLTDVDLFHDGGSSIWAPENVDLGNGVNLAVVCNYQPPPDGKHRVGWVMSKNGAGSGKWSHYADGTLDLGNAPGGEIDPHVFTDDSGQRYIVWKTDDNSVQAARTRIWAQPCHVSEHGLTLTGERKMIMDSTGLWWVSSFVPGGSLVEGPEIVRRGAYYYLFFASGKFCQDSYSEGVARATNVMGPYRKLGVPLLSTNMVGSGADGKLVGPGHASYMKNKAGVWYAMWHASEGHNCNRRAYVDALAWTADGWPYVDFANSLVANAASTFV